MAEAERRKGGGKLSRSETVTVRLDPKLRYLAELAARKQRRTLSSYIEWAIEDSLKHATLEMHGNVSLSTEAEELWDVDEADRFARLALRHPDLLTHEEQVLWKLVRENGALWRGNWSSNTREWTWTVAEQFLLFAKLREYWPAFSKVAESGTGHSELPDWVRTKRDEGGTKTKPSSGFDDMEDDIPF
jgi:hypothetical protein